MISPLKELRPGEIITAAWCNAVVRQLRAICPQPSNDISVSTQPGGTTFNLRRISRGNAAERESLFAYPAGDDVKVTAGNIQHVFNGVVVTVAEATLTPDDGDKVWIERTDANTWESNSGADYPTDALYIPLVDNVSVGSDGASIDAADYCWFGGDIVLPEIFPVTDSNDGGDAGSCDSDCSFTYTATTLGDIEVDTGMEPDNGRMSGVTYSAGSNGIAYIKADGSFGLIVSDETPQTTTKCLAVVDSVDSSTGCITAHAEKFAVFDNSSCGSCP